LAATPVPDDAPAQTTRYRVRRGNADATDASEAGVSRASAKLRFGAVSLAALADSVNPCAFATIIILVAMMSSAKRTKNEIIAVCFAFTLSVFLTYLAIGLFLYKLIAMINASGGWFLIVADCIYYLAFLLCAVCAVLSLRDAWLLATGRSAEEMVLKLPAAFKKRINLAMAKGVRARWLMTGVFIAGVTVSFFEAACTGQVYLPTIIALVKMNFLQSLLLLVWYNFLFILPLLIIFGLVLLGVTSAQLADFFKKNVAWTKLALGVVFIIMALVIWHEMYWPPGYRGQPVAKTETEAEGH
jgi:MFS family permease